MFCAYIQAYFSFASRYLRDVERVDGATAKSDERDEENDGGAVVQGWEDGAEECGDIFQETAERREEGELKKLKNTLALLLSAIPLLVRSWLMLAHLVSSGILIEIVPR